MSFDKRLVEAMAEEGLNQGALGRLVGKSQAAVSRWLSGSVPRRQTILKLAKTLRVSADWLMEGKGEKREHLGLGNVYEKISALTLTNVPEAERKRIVTKALNAAKSEFPLRLKALRETLGMGVREFAVKCAFSASYISRIEREKRRVPSWQFIERLMKTFPGLSRDWILHGTGPRFVLLDMADLDKTTLALFEQINREDSEVANKRLVEKVVSALKLSDRGLFNFMLMVKESPELGMEQKRYLVRALNQIISERISKFEMRQ